MTPTGNNNERYIVDRLHASQDPLNMHIFGIGNAR